ncbi:hypothetical protein LO772_11815 [Yinghuangia sp. ASG 101]|uniref:hypothetical protein n=1 Tax=Yinghuangia sp. ASG 101 TaxID=2896848 RepID=UPI001E30179D|nr:hypothetical protein [Yinghuangia sp. ASG 101]UGQ15717.1 hypothetical protein LO772_11815 [Yinghuangia sp. ASG 101]
MTTLFPADTPVVTGARTREDAYQMMRRFLLASGATEPDDYITIHHLPCDGPSGPRQSSDGYYYSMVMGGFRAVGDDTHEAFARMREHARASGFTIGTYRNPASAPPDDRIKSWTMTGGTSEHHGIGFSIFTVSPQTHVAIWVTSTCRVTPDRDEVNEYFALPSMLPHVPATPPVWRTPTPAPPVPPSPTAPPNSPLPPPGSPPGIASGPAALGRIRDILG